MTVRERPCMLHMDGERQSMARLQVWITVRQRPCCTRRRERERDTHTQLEIVDQLRCGWGEWSGDCLTNHNDADQSPQERPLNDYIST